jgi:uncharacterized membrane protein YgcG
MPAGMGEEERFAAAVEYGTTPASHGRGADSADSLARELEIVALLRAGGPALGPEPAARDRAKRQMMAAFAQEFGRDSGYPTGDDAGSNAMEATGPLQVLAPVALAERAPARHAEPTPRRRSAERTPLRAGRHSAPEPDPVEDPGVEDEPELDNVRRLRPARTATAPRRGHSRAALIGAAAAAALVAIAGTGTFASRDALPGDSMYGVKRVAESTSYALTFGERAKARRHLEQAQRRLDEVEGMVARSRTAQTSGSASASAAQPDQELLRDTMQEFDSDTSEGSRLLLAGPTPPDTAQVDEVRTWATQQSERLSGLRSTLPAPDRADESLALLDRVLGETDALAGTACQPAEDVTGAATTAAPVDACGSSGSSAGPELTGTQPVPTPERGATARAGSSAAARAGDTDGDAGAGTDATADASSDGDGASARTTTTGSGSAGTDDRRRDGGGGSGGSGGSGDVSVPLPLPAKVGVPSVGGLPGLSVG